MMALFGLYHLRAIPVRYQNARVLHPGSSGTEPAKDVLLGDIQPEGNGSDHRHRAMT